MIFDAWLRVKKISLARGTHTNVKESGGHTFVTSSGGTQEITDVGDAGKNGAMRAEVSVMKIDGRIRFFDNLRRCPVCGSRKHNLTKGNLTEHLVKEHGWVERGIVVRQPNGDWIRSEARGARGEANG